MSRATLLLTLAICLGCEASPTPAALTTSAAPLAIAHASPPGRHGCAAEVSQGSAFTCARLTDGSARCSGIDVLGTLGDGRSGVGVMSASFVPVSNLGRDVAQVAAGARHACALKTDGTLWCWGSGDQGQLGNGLQGAGVLSATPLQVTALGDQVAEVSVGDSFSCARKRDGTVWCWGYNLDGELGAGFFSNDPSQPVGVASPVQVIGLPAIATSISCAAFHTCARLVDQRAFCWGNNTLGELGNGLMANSATPQFVATLDSSVRVVAGGRDQTCAITTGGQLWCWGGNITGDLGIGTDFGLQLTPVAVTALRRVESVELGNAHSCAITREHKLFCWGNVQSSRIYNTLEGYVVESNVPAQVRRPRAPFAQVSVGFASTCAVTIGRRLYCTGANFFGELGLGDTVDRTELTLVPLACGRGHGADDHDDEPCGGEDD
jgi:alpha-tubulin suppressor-like RCC1 family protein